jgi:hypothetical protein
VHVAVDTLGHLLALHVTAANEQDRAQVEELARQVQEATGDNVQIATEIRFDAGCVDRPNEHADVVAEHLSVCESTSTPFGIRSGLASHRVMVTRTR